MKLIIAGSRSLMANQVVQQAIDALLHPSIVIDEVVSGAATGVDELGEQWAASKGIPIKQFPVSKADWDRHGKAAGPMRNKLMADYADGLLAIWDGRSRGTANMIGQMRSLNKFTVVWRV